MDLFTDEQYVDRDDIRLTLDKVDDYELFKDILHHSANYDESTLRSEIDYIDRRKLAEINLDISQKTIRQIFSRSPVAD